MQQPWSNHENLLDQLELDMRPFLLTVGDRVTLFRQHYEHQIALLESENQHLKERIALMERYLPQSVVVHGGEMTSCTEDQVALVPSDLTQGHDPTNMTTQDDGQHRFHAHSEPEDLNLTQDIAPHHAFKARAVFPVVKQEQLDTREHLFVASPQEKLSPSRLTLQNLHQEIEKQEAIAEMIPIESDQDIPFSASRQSSKTKARKRSLLGDKISPAAALNKSLKGQSSPSLPSGNPLVPKKNKRIKYRLSANKSATEDKKATEPILGEGNDAKIDQHASTQQEDTETASAPSTPPIPKEENVVPQTPLFAESPKKQSVAPMQKTGPKIKRMPPANSSDKENTNGYQETVRNKAERKQMHAGDCSCCRGYFEMTKNMVPKTGNVNADLAAEEAQRQALQKRKQMSSRHRHMFAIPSTPEGFWDIDFKDEIKDAEP